MLQINASQRFKRLILPEKPQVWQTTACDHPTLKAILNTLSLSQSEESCWRDISHRRSLLLHSLQLLGPWKDRTKEILPENKPDGPGWPRSSHYLQGTDTLLFPSYQRPLYGVMDQRPLYAVFPFPSYQMEVLSLSCPFSVPSGVCYSYTGTIGCGATRNHIRTWPRRLRITQWSWTWSNNQMSRSVVTLWGRGDFYSMSL